MWLKSFAHAHEVREMGLPNATTPGHQDEIRYWKIHQPIVTSLLHDCRVVVACDSERATYEASRPAVIWAWACFEGDTVHWVGVKRNVAAAGFAADLMADLLGSRADAEQRTTFELTDLKRLQLVPKAWKRDRGWLAALRSLSTRMLEHDSSFARVGSYVLDVRRREWEVAA